MAWTAELINKSLDNEAIIYTVRYGDGTRQFDKRYRLSGDDLKAAVRAHLDVLENLDAANSANPPGPINPPATNTALLQFRTRLQRLKSAQKAIDLGVIDATNPAYVTLKNQVTTAVQNDVTLLQYF